MAPNRAQGKPEFKGDTFPLREPEPRISISSTCQLRQLSASPKKKEVMCQIPITDNHETASSTQLDEHAHFPNYGNTRKEKLRLLLDEPSSSRMAFWITVFIALAIISSSVAAIVETVPAYYRSQQRLWFYFEGIVVTIFSLEFLIRCYAHSTTLRQFGRFMGTFYTLVDLVAILPYYLGLLVLGDEWLEMQRFTVLRLFRLLRLFRCYTFSSLLQLSIDALVLAVQKSTDALVALLVFLSFVMVAFSTLMYFAERGTWDPAKRTFVDIMGEPSQFSSIPASFWYVSEIITTVGLGDIHPKTTLGRTFSVPLMMFSLLIIALPSIVIGRNFAESWAWLRSCRPARRSMTIAPTLSSPSTAPLRNSPPAARETHFLAELSTMQLPGELNHHGLGVADRIPLPPPSNDVAEHGEVMLGILQELQRQNELLERLVLAGLHSPISPAPGAPFSRPGSVHSCTNFGE